MSIRYTVLLSAVFFLVMTLVFYAVPTYAEPIDFTQIYRPLALKAFSTPGFDPYSENDDGRGLYNPVHILLYALPFALLPEGLGVAAFLAANLAFFLIFALRAGFGPIGTLAFMLNPLVILNVYYGNIDGLVLFGAVLPPALGVFLLTLKPQVGFGLIVYYAATSVLDRDLKMFLQLALSVLVVCLVSVAASPIWPKTMLEMSYKGWNSSLFPYSMLIGIPLLAYAVKGREKFTALSTAPMFAPYLAWYSWATALPLFRRRSEILVAIAILMWGIALTGWRM